MSFRFLNDSSGGFQGEQVVTPSETFIDPVSKIRVSNPSNLIDTDFEYGLQPTKWETVELINNTPAFFSKGGDTTIPDIISITTNAGTREITVETAFPHALDPGIPIRVSGTRSVTADGSYIINATPSLTTFTYLARANQPETISIFDLYTSIITGEFFQGSQISIADAEGITTDGAGPASDLLVRTTTKHGFGNNTPFYFLNLNSTVSQEFESQNTTSVSFDPTNAATALSFDGSNTLLQTPIDLSNSATTSIFQSAITGVNINENTITVSLASGEDWSNLRLGDPLYYSVTVASGFFNQNPRGVVFIKDVSGVDQANETATFQVSQLPDGDPINITSNITGFFQIADQARTFAGNNVDPETQIDIFVEVGEQFSFDGANLGYIDAVIDDVNTQFSVINDGSGAYLINADSNPTLTLERGRTYTFNIDAGGHPFWIQSSPAPYDPNETLGESDGVVNNGTDNGVVTFAVPQNAPNNLYYVCQFHPAMSGSFNIVNQPEPPNNEGTVIGYAGSNITIGSASQELEYYFGAMLKYETTGTPPAELVNEATYFVVSFNASVTPGLFTMSISEIPGGDAISFTSTGSGTQTFQRIGVSVDKNIVHIRNTNFERFDMLEYSYPEDNGDGGFLTENPDDRKRFYFVANALGFGNYTLNPQPFVPITATGGTVSEVVDNGRVYRVHSFTSVGTSSFNVLETGTDPEVEYLVVGGGGAGGRGLAGGGGAGGLLSGTTSVDIQNYTISVGAGGVGVASDRRGSSGANSAFGTISALGGGGGGAWTSVINLNSTGASGGSGGGAAGGTQSPSNRTRVPGAAGTQGQGNNGGSGIRYLSNNRNAHVGGGGGGAGAPGQAGADTDIWQRSGDGGDGLPSRILGTEFWFAAGGGASTYDGYPSAGNGGRGGGGGGSHNNQSIVSREGIAGGDGINSSGNGQIGADRVGGSAGANTGSGGGGASWSNANGGSGGSGIVVIRYPITSVEPVAPVASGGDEEVITVTENNQEVTYKVHKFFNTGSSTFSVSETGNLGPFEFLIVAGGGAGGNRHGGGGGGGGVIQGAQVLSPGTYPITVGAGGPATFNQDIRGNNGSNSSAFGRTAIGGGGGATWGNGLGLNGGSGGGGSETANRGGLGTPGQGFTGASSQVNGLGNASGGGGAGDTGQQAVDHVAGAGGSGRISNILGQPFYFGGGGGGGNWQSASSSRRAGNGGLGGGGGGGQTVSGTAGLGGGGGLNNGQNGLVGNPSTGGSGGQNTGGGGGGGGSAGQSGLNGGGGSGGSGCVIVRYKIELPQEAS